MPLQPRRRADRALLAAVQQASVAGVRPVTVDDLVAVRVQASTR